MYPMAAQQSFSWPDAPGRDSPGADGHGRGRLRGRGLRPAAHQPRSVQGRPGPTTCVSSSDATSTLVRSSSDAQQRAATDLSEMRSRTVSIKQILRTVD